MAGPTSAAPAAAGAPPSGSRPVTAQAAAAADAPPNAEISQEPTLIGEVGLNTRSMFRKRSGRPRSATKATPDRPIAPAAAIFDALACLWLPAAWANPASTEEAPARPPKNRYPPTSRVPQTGSLMIGLP